MPYEIENVKFSEELDTSSTLSGFNRIDHDDAVNRVYIIEVAGTGEGLVNQWNLSTTDSVSSASSTPDVTFDSGFGNVADFAWGDNGQYLFILDDSDVIHRFNTGTDPSYELTSLASSADANGGFPAPSQSHSMSIGYNGEFIATSGDGINVYQVDSSSNAWDPSASWTNAYTHSSFPVSTQWIKIRGDGQKGWAGDNFKVLEEFVFDGNDWDVSDITVTDTFNTDDDIDANFNVGDASILPNEDVGFDGSGSIGSVFGNRRVVKSVWGPNGDNVYLITIEDGNTNNTWISQLNQSGSNQPISTYEWSSVRLSDSTTVWSETNNSATASNSFTEEGDYDVTLTIEDEGGATASTTTTITVLSLVTTVGSSNIGSQSATLEGSLDNFEGGFAEVDFEYREQGATSWNSTPGQTLLSTGSYTENISGLTPNTTYEFQSFGIDSTGNNETGNIQTFTTVANQPPDASFSFSPTSPVVNQDVDFDGTTSSDPDGSISSYDWEAVNKNTNNTEWTDSGSATTTQQFSDDVDYEVTLTVVDDDGASDSEIKTVSTETRPPDANFNFTPTSPDTNETVNFNDQTTAPDALIDTWEWDFGNGNSKTITSSPGNTSHAYPAPGSKTVTLTVTDTQGKSDSIQKTVIVETNVNFTFSPQSPREGEIVKFNNKTSGIENFEWSFGDGTKVESKNPNHKFNSPGSYDVELTASTNGFTGTEIKNVFVDKFTVNDIDEDNFDFFIYPPAGFVSEEIFITPEIPYPENYEIVWIIDGSSLGILDEFTYTFFEQGPHEIKMQVTDKRANVRSKTIPFLVMPEPDTRLREQRERIRFNRRDYADLEPANPNNTEMDLYRNFQTTRKLWMHHSEDN